MEVEEFTKRTKKWKRKWKRDRSLDAGKKHGLWGIGDRGRTCPVPSPANGRFTGSHLLLGPAVPAPTACLHPWWYQGTGLFAAVLGKPKGRHSPEHSLSFPSSLELGKILPSQEKLGKLDKILSSRLASSPPSPLQRILTTCMSDVRAIPPPIVDGMPCFRSMIRAASWGMRHHDPLQPGPASEFSLILSSTHTLDRELSPSPRGPGADGRLPAAGHAIGLCILFQKSSRAATVTMPKGAHLTIGCYDHHESTKRGRDCAEHPGAAETAIRYRSIAPARLDNPFPGPEQLGPSA